MKIIYNFTHFFSLLDFISCAISPEDENHNRIAIIKRKKKKKYTGCYRCRKCYQILFKYNLSNDVIKLYCALQFINIE